MTTPEAASLSPARPIYVNGRFLTQPLIGVQRYAFNIVRRLPQDAVVVFTPKAPRPEYENRNGLQIRELRSILPTHLWEQFVLPRSTGSGLLWSPAGLGSFLVRRTVLTIHDLAVFEKPFCYGRATRAWYSTLYPFAARAAQRILTVSNYSKEAIVRILGVPEMRVVVTHLGVDPFFTPRATAAVADVKRRFQIADRYILAVGALSPRKNLGRLLEAWRAIAPLLRDVQLVLVAEGHFSFFSMADLGTLPERCMRLTGIDDETLALLYSGATAFVYPSIYEGFGLPVIEAMACGAPVITSNVTALPEVVGNAAFQVDPYDVHAIAEAIEAVATSGRVQEELRAKGFNRAALFSWDDTARQTWQTLQEAAS